MKVALCLSGQPRNATNKFFDIYNNIIKPNNADVFIHMWYDSKELNIASHKSDMFKGCRVIESNIDEKLNNLYKPKKIMIEKHKRFKNKLKLTDDCIKNCISYETNTEETRERMVNNSYSMWYSIMKSNLLKEEYALENGIQYDCIIRLRFDVSPTQLIDVSKYNLNKLIYADIGQPKFMMSDWFAFSNNDNMNIYSETFFHIEKHYKKCIDGYNYWCNEMLLSEQCKNIESERIIFTLSW